MLKIGDKVIIKVDNILVKYIPLNAILDGEIVSYSKTETNPYGVLFNNEKCLINLKSKNIIRREKCK